MVCQFRSNALCVQTNQLQTIVLDPGLTGLNYDLGSNILINHGLSLQTMVCHMFCHFYCIRSQKPLLIYWRLDNLPLTHCSPSMAAFLPPIFEYIQEP